MIQLQKALTAIILSGWLAILPAGAVQVEDNPVLLQMAREELIPMGTLRQTEEGFVYLDVDDDFIFRLAPLIDAGEYELQLPPYFSGDRRAGAHVTVMSAEEVGQYGVGAIGELGKQYVFTVTAFGSIALEKARAWFVIVECPKLSLLRHKYGLPAKEMAFHITVATGRRNPNHRQ